MQRALLQGAMVLGLSVAVAGSAAAQGRGRGSSSYPPGFRPPPGMCRVWIQGVPPGRQPGVTDCASARASASANATVLYGDRTDDPSYRGRTGTYSRTVYDSYGNRVTQRVQRNANGTVSVLGSTPYGSNGGMNGKMLPGTTNDQIYGNGNANGRGHYKADKKGHGKKDHDDHGDHDRN